MSDPRREEHSAVRRAPRTILSWTLLAAAATTFCAHSFVYRDWTEDDAFISYRYAQQLAAGKGLVFNPGERVEGYSNFTWVLLAAAGIRAGMEPITLSRTIGLLAGLSSLLLSWVLARRILPRIGLTALLAPFYVAVSPILARHSVAGLETSLFALLVIGAILSASTNSRPRVSRSVLFAVLLVTLSTTRPEGPLIAGVLLLTRTFVASRSSSTAGQSTGPEPRPFIALEWTLYALLFGAYYLWRWSYFGEPFANTYYVRFGDDLHRLIDGFQYTVDFLRDSGGVFFMGLAVVPFFAGSTRPIFWACLTVLATYVAFVIASGGDWMYHYRFYAHVLPVWVALIAAGIQHLLELPRAGTWRAGLLHAAALLFLLATFASVGNTELRVARVVLPAVESHNYLSQNYEELALWLKENTDRDATIAISDVGAVAYYSDRRIVDMFGLLDLHIARLPGRIHYKADPEYVLSRNPDYIVLVSRENQGDDLFFERIPDARMHALSEFQQRYELVRSVPQHWQNERHLVYRRKG